MESAAIRVDNASVTSAPTDLKADRTSDLSFGVATVLMVDFYQILLLCERRKYYMLLISNFNFIPGCQQKSGLYQSLYYMQAQHSNNWHGACGFSSLLCES